MSTPSKTHRSLVSLIPDIKLHFGEADSLYEETREWAVKGIDRFEWSRTKQHAAQPYVIEREGGKPGSALKGEPQSKKGKFRHGISAEGEVLMEEEYVSESQKYETYFEYAKRGVDVMRFDCRRGKKAIHVGSVFYHGGRPIGSLFCSATGIFIETYEYKNGLLIRAEHWEQEHDPKSPRHELAPRYVDEFKHTRGQLSGIKRVRATVAKTPVAKVKPAKLDLRKDFAEIYDYLTKRVRTFSAKKHKGPGAVGEIKFIEAGFQYSQAGWVAIVFDTRPKAKPDGEWTMYIEGNDLARPHWEKISGKNERHPLALVQPDGSEVLLPPHSELALPLGEMLKAVLLKARADGIFASLPLAKGCECGVEHLEGAYGWPAYKDRGKENWIVTRKKIHQKGKASR